MIKTLTLCLLLFATSATTGAVAQTRPGLLPDTFKGARLGITVEGWRSLAPPPGIGPDSLPVCSNELRTEKWAGLRLSATEAASGVVACTYASRFGHTVLPHSVTLDTGETVSDLAFLFSRDRLTEIRFEVPVAAYDTVSSRLTSDYGRPRRQFGRAPVGSAGAAPRIRETWRAPQGWVMLTNPSEDPTQASVRYLSRTAPGLADELSWNPADPRPDH
ncbi:MAG TPA: hypothetical protein VGF71_14555 [Caulobacteraceae bacterium]